MSYLVNPYMVTAAGGYWYEHINETDIDTYFFARTGTEDWRWGIRVSEITDGAGNTLNSMDVQWRIKTGTPTMQIIGRLWDDSNPAVILDTLNFEDSGSGTYLTGSDITSSFEWYTATAASPTVVDDDMIIGIEALNAGTSPASNYMTMARSPWVPSPTPANYNGWSGSVSQGWQTNSPYRMNQRLS